MADKVYYSVVDSGTTATTLTFFNQNEGDDGEVLSNLSENKKLQRDFVLRRMALIPSSDITNADALKLMEKAVVKLTINRSEVIKMPAAYVLGSSFEVFGSNGGLTTGQTDVVGLNKPQNGYEFTEAPTIPANTEFDVKLILNTAFATDTALTFVIEGTER